MLVLAWVRLPPLPTKNPSTNCKQVAAVTFEFCLLAAGFAGLGHHTRYVDKTQQVILNKVSQTHIFLTVSFTRSDSGLV